MTQLAWTGVATNDGCDAVTKFSLQPTTMRSGLVFQSTRVDPGNRVIVSESRYLSLLMALLWRQSGCQGEPRAASRALSESLLPQLLPVDPARERGM